MMPMPHAAAQPVAGGGLTTSRTLKITKPAAAPETHIAGIANSVTSMPMTSSTTTGADPCREMVFGETGAPDADREDQHNRGAVRRRGLWQRGPQQKAGRRTKCARCNRGVAETETGGECECGGNQRHTSIPRIRAGGLPGPRLP